jgi:hypothetical protein
VLPVVPDLIGAPGIFELSHVHTTVQTMAATVPAEVASKTTLGVDMQHAQSVMSTG